MGKVKEDRRKEDRVDTEEMINGAMWGTTG